MSCAQTINREVLEWLRGWDLCVFGHKQGSAAAAAEAAMMQGGAGARTLDNNMLQSNMLAPAQRKKVSTHAYILTRALTMRW